MKQYEFPKNANYNAIISLNVFRYAKLTEIAQLEKYL